MSKPALQSYWEEQNDSVWWSSGDYPFDVESIFAHVSQESGVYGLHDSKHSLFIGESANLRQALLAFFHNTDLLAGSYRPTGFMFELCSAQARAQRARELSDKYRPVMHTELFSDNSWSFVSDQEMEGVFTLSPDLENRFKFPYEPMPEEARNGSPKRFSSALGKGAVLAALLALAVSVIVYARMFDGGTNQRIASRVLGRSGPVISNESSSPGWNVGAPVAGAPIFQGAGGSVIQTESGKGRFDGESREKTNKAAHVAATSTANPELGFPLQKLLEETSAAERNVVWTVQIAASPAKETMEKQIASLKAKSYDVYVTETERDGRIWHRLRVGRFTKREEADALRGMLENREGYRGAYVTAE